MRATIALQEGLRDEDIQWLFQVGQQRVVEAGTAIVREGARPSAIFVVIRGGFDVGVDALMGEPLARLGTGELIGEISFLEGSPASATIVADEESVVLVVNNQVLNERFRENTAFAARMYRAFALVAERRLRNRVDHLAFLFDFANAFCDRRSSCIRALD